MVLTARQVRQAAAGFGLIDLAPEPASSYRRLARALAVRDELARVARPYDPRGVRVALPDGTMVRRCFGRTGYGAGFSGDPMMCQERGQCEHSAACYEQLRAVVEATDPRAGEFDRRQVELRMGGMDGRAASERLRGEGVPMPFEDAVLGNEELGRLDTGKWARCSDCERVPMKRVMVGGKCPRCAARVAGD